MTYLRPCFRCLFPRILPPLCALMVGLGIARAAQARPLELASHGQRTPIRERGFTGGFVARPGFTVVRGGLLPALRLSLMLGGAINSHFKFGVAPTLTGYGQAKRVPTGGLDCVAAIYPWQGLYARGGFGLVLGLPVSMAHKQTEGGFGGLIGAGWEFHLSKKSDTNGGIGFGVDYDIRRMIRGPLRHSLFFGVNFSW